MGVIKEFSHITQYQICYAHADSPLLLIWVRLLHCRAKKVVRLPDYHFVDHRIGILSNDRDYNNVKLYEHAEAHSGLPRQAK